MGTIDMENGIEEFDTVREFFFGVGDHDEVKTRPAVKDRYALRYESSYSGTIQIVVGTLRLHQSEYATIRTDDGVEYTVCGYGLADRETGDVIKKTDDDRREVGTFDKAYAASEGEQ